MVSKLFSEAMSSGSLYAVASRERIIRLVEQKEL